MARNQGPECPEGHGYWAQVRVYQRRSDSPGVQRFHPLAWFCLEDGKLHDFDDEVPQSYLPVPERTRRRMIQR